jgi:hypothetical protein
MRELDRHLFHEYGLSTVALARLFLIFDSQVRLRAPKIDALEGELHRRFEEGALQLSAIGALAAKRDEAWTSAISIESLDSPSPVHIPKASQVEEAFNLYRVGDVDVEMFKIYFQANFGRLRRAISPSLDQGFRRQLWADPVLAGKVLTFVLNQEGFNRDSIAAQVEARRFRRNELDARRAEETAMHVALIRRNARRNDVAKRWEKVQAEHVRRGRLGLEFAAGKHELTRIESLRQESVENGLTPIDAFQREFFPVGTDLLLLHSWYWECFELPADGTRPLIDIVAENIELEPGFALAIYRTIADWFERDLAAVRPGEDKNKLLFRLLFPQLPPTAFWKVVISGDWVTYALASGSATVPINERAEHLQNLANSPWSWGQAMSKLMENLTSDELHDYARQKGDPWGGYARFRGMNPG